MSEYIQFSIPYSVSQDDSLNFYIFFTTLMYSFYIQTSTNGSNWTTCYTFDKFFNTEYSVTDIITIPQNNTKYFRFVAEDSLEPSVKIKEFSIYKILIDGSYQRIIPIFYDASVFLTDPVVPSSLIGSFTVTSSIGSSGPANLFDLTKETVYISDLSFDISGTYIGSDEISVGNQTYYGTYIDIQFPYTINFDSYSIISSNNVYKFPKKWILVGSTNGTVYSNILSSVTLDTVVYPYTCYSFLIDGSVAYKSVRFIIQNTFAAVQSEFSEFSLSSFFYGGRVIPVSIQPITQDRIVTFGVRQGNAREVYSGISVSNPEWIRITFPYYPGNVTRIGIEGEYLPSDIDVYNMTNNSIIATVVRNLSVTGELSINTIDNSQSTFDFKFVFKRLQPNTDGYSRIKISRIIFYDAFGNRMNFLWDPTIQYYTYNQENQITVLTEKTIEGGEYLGTTRSFIRESNIYIYGEYSQLSYATPVTSSGFYINTNGLGWTILGSNDAQSWDILYTMNPFVEIPSYPKSSGYTVIDEYSIQVDSYIIRCSEPNLNLQNLLLLDPYQQLNGEYRVPDPGTPYWYNGASPQYGFTGRDEAHYTYIPGLDPTTYDSTLLADYTPIDENDPTRDFIPKAINGVYGVYFDYIFPTKVHWRALRVLVNRFGSIPIFSPRWVFFFGSNDGQNWTMFTKPQYYSFPFYNSENTKQEYTYIFDFYNEYYSHFRFQIASCGTGEFDIGSIQWIGDSSPHEIFKTVTVNSSYSKYRGVVTNSNASPVAHFIDFAVLDSLGQRIDGNYSGGEYQGTSSYQGIPGEYITISQPFNSLTIVSSSCTFKKFSVVNQDGTVKTYEDDRYSGTYLCDSPLLLSKPPTLPYDYELVLVCPTAVPIGSFSFTTDSLVIHYNASLPVSFKISGALDDDTYVTIQEYTGQILEYDKSYTYQVGSQSYKKFKFTVTGYNKTDGTFLSIYNFQMYSPLGYPLISNNEIIPDIHTINEPGGPCTLVFQNVETLDGQLHIDDIILS